MRVRTDSDGKAVNKKPVAPRTIDTKLMSKMMGTVANKKALKEFLQEHPHAIVRFDLKSIEMMILSCLSPETDQELLLTLMCEDHGRSWESKKLATTIMSISTKHPLTCLTAHRRGIDVVGSILQEKNGLEALRELMQMNVFASTEIDTKMIQKIMEDIAPKLNLPKAHQEHFCDTNGVSIKMRLRLAVEYVQLQAKQLQLVMGNLICKPPGPTVKLDNKEKTLKYYAGMTCGGCSGAVTRIVTSIEGVRDVKCDVEQKEVVVIGTMDEKTVTEKLTKW
mmetsp:Transcript_27512/g.38405  ORF Transcript_27512/g.38405 Transcript_27512/m.38405 type:complete len:279 (+) Transcript_27512:544-1380(+)